MIGHKPQIDILKRAIATNRIAGAYLFAGPDGIGKKLVGEIFMQSLACTVSPPENFSPCGNCVACQKIASNNHPDRFLLDVLEDKSLISIEQVRDIQGKIQFHPLEAKSKFVLINDADLMSQATANALLKTLEEPPPDTHFILISSRPMALLPTIRSRCQIIAFTPLSDAEIQNFLLEHHPETKQASVISRLASGSIGLALKLDPELVSGVTEKIGFLSAQASAADIISAAEAWSKEPPERIELIFTVLSGFYRDILRFKATSNPAELFYAGAKKSADNMSLADAVACIAEIERTRGGLEGHANKALMFEQLLFTLTDSSKRG